MGFLKTRQMDLARHSFRRHADASITSHLNTLHHTAFCSAISSLCCRCTLSDHPSTHTHSPHTPALTSLLLTLILLLDQLDRHLAIIRKHQHRQRLQILAQLFKLLRDLRSVGEAEGRLDGVEFAEARVARDLVGVLDGERYDSVFLPLFSSFDLFFFLASVGRDGMERNGTERKHPDSPAP